MKDDVGQWLRGEGEPHFTHELFEFRLYRTLVWDKRTGSQFSDVSKALVTTYEAEMLHVIDGVDHFINEFAGDRNKKCARCRQLGSTVVDMNSLSALYTASEHTFGRISIFPGKA